MGSIAEVNAEAQARLNTIRDGEPFYFCCAPVREVDPESGKAADGLIFKISKKQAQSVEKARRFVTKNGFDDPREYAFGTLHYSRAIQTVRVVIDGIRGSSFKTSLGKNTARKQIFEALGGSTRVRSKRSLVIEFESEVQPDDSEADEVLRTLDDLVVARRCFADVVGRLTESVAADPRMGLSVALGVSRYLGEVLDPFWDAVRAGEPSVVDAEASRVVEALGSERGRAVDEGLIAIGQPVLTTLVREHMGTLVEAVRRHAEARGAS